MWSPTLFDEGALGGDASVASNPAELCSANSFTAATPVLLASGSQTAISKVAIGDEILATDPQTGQTLARPVLGLIVHRGEHTMVRVTLADGSTITSTDHHPFWDATTATFTYAIALHVGDNLRGINGQPMTITSILVFDENVTAYNLNVSGIHTYYAGTTPVLVHNACLISMDEAVSRAVQFVGGEGKIEVSGSGGFQFRTEYVDANGDAITQTARLDVNPASGHVQAEGLHLNLETQINHVTVRSGPFADPHILIDPSTIRPGDIP